MLRSRWAILLVALSGWACGSTPGNPTGSSTTSSSTPTTIPQTTITTTSSSGGTGFTVSGTVTDATSGGVLPNIAVRITDGPNSGKSATTGSAGTYAIPAVTAGTMTLSASATGYVTQTKSVVVSADTRADWVLVRVVTTTTTVTPQRRRRPSRQRRTATAAATTSTFRCSSPYPAGDRAPSSNRPVSTRKPPTTCPARSPPAGKRAQISGTLLNGTPANGSFDGTVFLNLTGCTASRHYTGTVTTAAVQLGQSGRHRDRARCQPWPVQQHGRDRQERSPESDIRGEPS